MPSKVQRCAACRKEFSARFDACPFCKTRVPPPPAPTPKKTSEDRWTEPQRRVVKGPGAFVVGRHLENLSVSWIHTRAAGGSLEEATRFLGTSQSGYGEATIFEVVAALEKPWPENDDRNTLRWETLTKGACALARPSIEWPRVMSERIGLGMLVSATDAKADALEALAARSPTRCFVLRSWGTFDTDSGYPIR